MKKNTQKLQRQLRIRKKLKGTSTLLRLSVFRSNKHIYAQIIDDALHQTRLSMSESGLQENEKLTKTEIATKIGQELALRAKKQKIVRVCFDKGSYRYHGRVKALAEGAREGGLQF